MKKSILSLLILCSPIFLLNGQTYISDPLSGGTFLWDTAGSPFIVSGSLVVEYNARLMIEPGVIIMFEYNPDPEQKASLIVRGQIQAEGTESEPIIFTSFRDDSYGDHNMDGRATISKPGDWGFIEFNNLNMSSYSLLLNTIIKYGGGASKYGYLSRNQNLPPERRPMVIIYDDIDDLYEPIEIDNSTLSHSMGIGIIMGKGKVSNTTISHCHHGIEVTSSNCEILTNSIIDNTGYPIILDGPWMLMSSRSLMEVFSGNSVANNGQDVIALGGKLRPYDIYLMPAHLQLDWKNYGIPYLIYKPVMVQYGLVKIDPGTIIKFKAATDLSSITYLDVPWDGSLIAHGTDAEKIIFTSEYDRQYDLLQPKNPGRDPQAGDWGFIRGSLLSFNHCYFKYGGAYINENMEISDDSSAVLIIHDNDSLAPSIRNSMFRNLYNHGILVNYDTIARKPLRVQQSSFLLPYDRYGIKMSGTGQTDWGIDASNNYWNGKMGPFHADSNDIGNGCLIDGGIQFRDFLTESEDTLDLIASVVKGKVFNTEDEQVPHALVQLIGKTIKSVKSNEDGKFFIPNVRPGYGYKMKVQKYNYRDSIFDEKTVPPDSVLEANLYIEERQVNAVIDTITFNVNPGYISEVMVGGTATRYYKIIDIKSKEPVYGAEVFINGYDSTFISNSSGIVTINIPASAIGAANRYKDFYISKIGAESAYFPPALQMHFRIKVSPHEYMKKWSGNTFFKIGISVFEAQNELGAALGLNMKNNGSSEFADKLWISRSSKTGVGLVLSTPEAKVEFGSFEAGAEAKVGVNFSALFRDEFSFDYQNTGKVALAKFIVLADGALPYMDSPLMRYFVSCLERQNDEIDKAALKSSIGFGIQGFGSAEAGLEAKFPDVKGKDVPLGAEAKGSVGVSADIDFLFNRYAHSGQLDFDLSFVAKAEGKLSLTAGLNFDDLFGGKKDKGSDTDKKNGSKNDKLKGELKIPDLAGLAASGGGRFGLNIGTVRGVPEPSTHLGFLFGYKYSLAASALIWKAELAQDRTFQYTFKITDKQVVDIFNEKCNLAKNMFTQDPGNVDLNLSNLSPGSLFTKPFTSFVENQVKEAISFPPIPYEVNITDVVDEGGFNMELALGITVLRVKFGAGFKYETTNEYKKSEGVFYDFNLYPLATYNYLSDNKSYKAQTILQDIVTESADYIVQEITKELIPEVFRRIPFWPFNLKSEEGIHVGPPTRPLSELRVDEISTTDSLFVYYWDWYGTEGKPDARKSLDNKRLMISDYVRSVAAQVHKLDYGIGGFYQFEPYGRSFENANATLTIEYFDDELTVYLPDSTVYQIPETDLCMYKEDKKNNCWVYIGGSIDTDSNTVTAAIDSLGTYTLAPFAPEGSFSFTATPDTIDLDISDTARLVSEPIYFNTGDLISDGEMYTIEVSSGTIMNPDADSQKEGHQIGASNGTLTIDYQAGDYSGVAYVKASSTYGRSSGIHEIFVKDNEAPLAPVLANLSMINHQVSLNWQPVNDPDLVGYKIYYDLQSGAPYNGKASVLGDPSPIDAGIDTSFVISGLGKDSTYFFAITAIDRCGNESSYSNEGSIITQFNHRPVLYKRIFFIEPNLAKGTIIDTLWACDKERNQNLSYYLASNNTCDAFALDPITGEITVEDPQQVAYPGSSDDTLRLWAAVRDDFEPPAADSTEILIILKLNTSLPAIRSRKEFILDMYPNPATSEVCINFDDHGSVKEGKLQLINANGQVLYVKEYHAELPPTQMISIDHLPGGIYSVLFNTSERRCIGKLIIMR